MTLIAKSYRVVEGNREDLFRKQYADFFIIDKVPSEGRIILGYIPDESTATISLLKKGEKAVVIADEDSLIEKVLLSLEREAEIKLEEI